VAPTVDAVEDVSGWELAESNKKTEERLAKLIQKKEAEFDQLKGKMEYEFSTFFTGLKEELGKISRGELDEAEGAGVDEAAKESGQHVCTGSRRPTLFQKLTFGLFGGCSAEKISIELEEVQVEQDGQEGAICSSGEAEGELQESQEGAEEQSKDEEKVKEETERPAAEEEGLGEGEDEPKPDVPSDSNLVDEPLESSA